jgi:actin-like ATPase involved in cell morphogenesis
VVNIKKVLEVLSIPTLKSINEYGVILAGGFANIYGIEAYFKEKLELNIVKSKNPTLGIIDGMNIVLKNVENHILTKNSII